MSHRCSPLDLVKTRLQQQQQGVGGGPVKYRNPLHAFRTILAEEGEAIPCSTAPVVHIHPPGAHRARAGAGGLYSGLKPNLLGVFPEKALKLAVNDTLREVRPSRSDQVLRL